MLIYENMEVTYLSPASVPDFNSRHSRIQHTLFALISKESFCSPVIFFPTYDNDFCTHDLTDELRSVSIASLWMHVNSSYFIETYEDKINQLYNGFKSVPRTLFHLLRIGGRSCIDRFLERLDKA